MNAFFYTFGDAYDLQRTFTPMPHYTIDDVEAGAVQELARSSGYSSRAPVLDAQSRSPFVTKRRGLVLPLLALVVLVFVVLLRRRRRLS